MTMARTDFNLVNLMNQFYQQIAMVKRWINHDQLALEAKNPETSGYA
ncbi:hypothetical protein [Marinomonas rhodophyticola]|uniref:Uncharacterized protein n=1 Tax=Marinomonas rhodophyticola TaxID=2992803 RepID=A0ABT3KD95_9GAMM|nr:hypothetical protein [Marinomonas sp. KJ51-3]MCW4628459.1 hypothetical protein [Marinomonas sp. KJ51-3]